MVMTKGQMKKQIEKAPGTKRKKLKVPKKYLAGLSAADKAKRRKEIERNRKKSTKDKSAYKFATDFDKKVNAEKQNYQNTPKLLRKGLVKTGDNNEKEK